MILFTPSAKLSVPLPRGTLFMEQTMDKMAYFICEICDAQWTTAHKEDDSAEECPHCGEETEVDHMDDDE